MAYSYRFASVGAAQIDINKVSDQEFTLRVHPASGGNIFSINVKDGRLSVSEPFGTADDRRKKEAAIGIYKATYDGLDPKQREAINKFIGLIKAAKPGSYLFSKATNGELVVPKP